MTVAIFKEPNGKYGVLTNDEAEEKFIRNFCDCALRKIVREVTSKSSEEITYFVEGDSKSDNAPIEQMFEMFIQAIEISLKFRGYKSQAKERRELFSGNFFPSLPELSQFTQEGGYGDISSGKEE